MLLTDIQHGRLAFWHSDPHYTRRGIKEGLLMAVIIKAIYMTYSFIALLTDNTGFGTGFSCSDW